jgi:hypothetical protein
MPKLRDLLVWAALVAAPFITAGLADTQSDECWCIEQGKVWHALPDLCCWSSPRHPDDPMDGIVDVLDIMVVIENWGPCMGPLYGCCHGDIDRDHQVGVTDFLLVMSHYGEPPWTFERCR